VLKALGRDVAIYGAADFAFRLIAFAVFPIYAHVFTVEQFGVYALVSASAGLVALLANLGISNAAQRYYWDAEAAAATQPSIISTGLLVLVASSTAIVAVFAAIFLYAFLLGSGGVLNPLPTPAPLPSPSAAPSASPSAAPSVTPIPSESASPSAS